MMRTSTQPSYTKEMLEEVLKTRFGLDHFRPQQEEIIQSVLHGRDTLVIMPTGGGKSLCYQMPGLLMPGTAIIVSPLIALMKDQVDRLQRQRINAVALNSSLNFSQIRSVLQRAAQGDIKFLFVAPERFESSLFRDQLVRLDISFIAIDEAHCISEWGHDFRTSYRRIPEIYDYLPDPRPPVIALTATATVDVQRDIRTQLSLRDPYEIVTGFSRPNLHYGVMRECDKEIRLSDIISSVDSSAIVYGSTRKSVEKVTALLKSKGVTAESYHAGISLDLRDRVQERFQAGKTKIIVATNAFGMGVDKSDIRAVVHYDLPPSIESYYQESGRAGRDGDAALAVLLYNNGDARTHEFLIRNNTPTETDLRSVYSALHDIAANPIGGVYQGVLVFDSENLLRRIPKPSCDIERIIDVLEQEGYLKNFREAAVTIRPRVTFTVTRQRLEEIAFRSMSKAVKSTIGALLRKVGADAFSREVHFDDAEVMNSFQIKQSDFTAGIRTLESLGAIKYTAAMRPKAGASYHTVALLNERLPSNKVPLRTKLIKERMENALTKLGQMAEYAVGWNCRQTSVLYYFGEKPENPYCGKCDVCIARAKGEGPDAFMNEFS